MKEAFDTFDVDYVTLYDHGDKYTLEMYENLQSKILHSKNIIGELHHLRAIHMLLNGKHLRNIGIFM
jgi:hypothetical protein